MDARSSPERMQAWCGPSLFVSDAFGMIDGGPLTGFFFRETRFLSRLVLRVEGEAPHHCSSAEVATDALELSFIYPPVTARSGGGSGSGGQARHRGLLTRSLDLDLRYRLRPASIEVTLAIGNRWNERVEVEILWELAADFAALGETSDGDPADLPRMSVQASGSALRLCSLAPELPLETRITTESGEPWRWVDGALRARLVLGRQQVHTATLRIEAVDLEDPIDAVGEEARIAAVADYLDRMPRIHASDEAPMAVGTERALHDLGRAALLEGPEDEWLMPAAGYPLYPAAFGRDAATVSWQVGAFDRGEMAQATAARLARLQGRVWDDRRDERPGRIIQQARRDPRSRTGEVPFARYYGDVASPFMFIIALGNAYAWSGDRTLVERHWGAVRRVLDWARADGDPAGVGYIGYRTRSAQGPRHQGWKDSDNAVVDEAGRQVEPPVAPCEIQGYFHAALQFTAIFSLAMGRRREAWALWKDAARLKERFNRDFWLDDEGCVALGLDGFGRPIRAVTSNAAQCIPTGIVSDTHLPRLVRRIFEPDLFSGWGIRTLSARNPAYQPLSYHLGSVWPVENASILFGLRRYGFDDRALQLGRALHDLAALWPAGRSPECVGGYARHDRAHPGAYPRANAFQSWNQSVFPMLLQTILGAWAVAPLRVLFLDPVLPPWLPDVTVRRWRIGSATVSLRFWRDGDGASRFEVTEREGRLRIFRQPPPDSLTTGVRDRLGALLKGLMRDRPFHPSIRSQGGRP